MPLIGYAARQITVALVVKVIVSRHGKKKMTIKERNSENKAPHRFLFMAIVNNPYSVMITNLLTRSALHDMIVTFPPRNGRRRCKQLVSSLNSTKQRGHQSRHLIVRERGRNKLVCSVIRKRIETWMFAMGCEWWYCDLCECLYRDE